MSNSFHELISHTCGEIMLETPWSISESNGLPSIFVAAVLFDNTCKSFLSMSTIGWFGSAAAANASLLVGCKDGEEGHSGISPCGMAPGGGVGSIAASLLATLSTFNRNG